MELLDFFLFITLKGLVMVMCEVWVTVRVKLLRLCHSVLDKCNFRKSWMDGLSSVTMLKKRGEI